MLVVSSKKKKQSKMSIARRIRPSGSVASASMMSRSVVPAAVSIRSLNRSLTFGSVSFAGRTGCRITGTLPFITVGASNSNGYGFITSAGTRVGALALSPVNAAWLCPQVARLASCFTQYRWNRLSFQYNAMGSSASAVRLAFAFSSDYLNAVIQTSDTYTGYNALLTTQYSQVFSPWMDWSMTVPCGQELNYMYSYSDTVAANSRQSYGGIIGCLADANPLADYTYGVISLSFSLDLFDPMPLTTVPTLELLGPRQMIGAKHDSERLQRAPDTSVVEHDVFSSTTPGDSLQDRAQASINRQSSLPSSGQSRR